MSRANEIRRLQHQVDKLIRDSRRNHADIEELERQIHNLADQQAHSPTDQQDPARAVFQALIDLERQARERYCKRHDAPEAKRAWNELRGDRDYLSAIANAAWALSGSPYHRVDAALLDDEAWRYLVHYVGQEDDDGE